MIEKHHGLSDSDYEISFWKFTVVIITWEHPSIDWVDG